MQNRTPQNGEPPSGSQESSIVLAIKKFGNIGFTAVGVSAVLWPIELLWNWRVAGASTLTTFSGARLFQSFVAATKGAALKNATQGNRETLQGAIENTRDVHTSLEQQSHSDPAQIRWLPAVVGSQVVNMTNKYPDTFPILATSTLLGMTDATITQRYSTLKTLGMRVAVTNGQFVPPAPATFTEHIKLSFTGYTIRCVGSMASVAGLLAVEPLGKLFKDILSAENKEMAIPAANVVNGVAVGCLSNAIGVVLTEKISKISPQFTSPSTLDVVKNVGIKGLGKGSLISAAYLTAAYAAIPHCERFASAAVDKIEQTVRSFSLFKPKPKESAVTEPTLKKNHSPKP